MKPLNLGAIVATNPAVVQAQLDELRAALGQLKALGVDTDHTQYTLRRPFEDGAQLRTEAPVNLRTYGFRSGT